eukprot:1134116-Pelagomonas_calceolata.AAC.3
MQQNTCTVQQTAAHLHRCNKLLLMLASMQQKACTVQQSRAQHCWQQNLKLRPCEPICELTQLHTLPSFARRPAGLNTLAPERRSSFQNRGPPQHLAASSDVGVKDLLQVSRQICRDKVLQVSKGLIPSMSRGTSVCDWRLGMQIVGTHKGTLTTGGFSVWQSFSSGACVPGPAGCLVKSVVRLGTSALQRSQLFRADNCVTVWASGLANSPV